MIDVKKHDSEQVDSFNSYAIRLLEEIYQSLDALGNGARPNNTRGRKKKTEEKINNQKRNLREESWHRSIGDFLKQKPVLEDQQMYQLLSSAKDILDNKENEWNENQKKIFAVLEDIIEIGFQKGLLDKYFENYDKTVDSMINLDFSSRIPLTQEDKSLDMSNQNLLNYFTNTMNLVNEELEGKVISKSLVQSLINVTGKSQVIFMTDMSDKIKFISQCACLFYNLDDSYTNTPISQFFDNFDNLKGQALLRNNIRLRPVKFIIPNGSNKDKRIDVLLSMEISRDDNGETVGILYQLQPSPIFN